MSPVISAGDTAWVLLCSALVLLMTVGLAFFYGGLVRPKNALNTMMMSVIALGLVGVQWMVAGYSLAFHAGSGWLGGLGWVGFRGDDPPSGARGVPGDVRDHHPGAHFRGGRRAHAVPGVCRLSRAVGDAGLR